MSVLLTMKDVEAENGRLLGVMVDALAAMDRGEYGQARRILKTGKDKPVQAVTSVIARDGGVG